MYTIAKEVALLLFNNLHEKRITEKTRQTKFWQRVNTFL